MKRLPLGFLAASLFLALPASPARADDTIVGSWTYYKKVYQGKDVADPSGTLRLHFDFKPDGTDELYWWHEGENDHCHRNGTYKVENNTLEETATTVDPNNTKFCAEDPDMQPGKFSKIPVHFENGDLYLMIPLADQQLFFVWKKDADGKGKQSFLSHVGG